MNGIKTRSGQEKILFISLGCDKNLVDAERMLGSLADRGCTFTDDEEEADIAVVNTCCFIDAAKEESIGQILSLAQRKESGQLKALIVTGCMAQRYKEELLQEIPEVDAIVGTTAKGQLPEVLEEVLRAADAAGTDAADETAGAFAECPPVHRQRFEDRDLLEETGRRLLSTGGHYAYLKIAEGCDKHCTYCAIPAIRGRYRSVPMEDLLVEAADLARQGVKELILVAQETTRYGLDLYGEKRLPALLRALCRIDGLEWIRVLYCYPEEIDDTLIEVLRDEPRILHYLDIPIQHASDSILKRMGRRTDKAQLEALLKRLRREIPDICIRTTLITGFPGETEEDHRELMDFVRAQRFDRLGVFTYSREEGTGAARMKQQVPKRTKERRQRELMLLQQEIAFEKERSMCGKTFRVMVEGRITGEDVCTARTYRDAPDVDGTVFIETGADLMTGDMPCVRITDAREYDLLAVLCDEPEEIDQV